MPDLGNTAHKAGDGIKKLLGNKWVLYGGLGAGALVLGYLYLQNQAAAASSGGGGGYYTSASPIDYGSVAAAPASGGSSGGDSSGNDALAAAINAANQNSAAQNQEALMALQQSGAIAIANDQTSAYETQLATQASNYAASTNVLQTFIKGLGGQGAAVLGVGGWVDPTAAGGVSVGLYGDNSKNVTAWGNVLHGIASGGAPSTGSQSPTPANPVTVNPPGSSMITGPLEGTGGT